MKVLIILFATLPESFHPIKHNPTPGKANSVKKVTRVPKPTIVKNTLAKIFKGISIFILVFLYLMPNAAAHREPGLSAIRWSRLLAKINLDFPNNLNKPQQDYELYRAPLLTPFPWHPVVLRDSCLCAFPVLGLIIGKLPQS